MKYSIIKLLENNESKKNYENMAVEIVEGFRQLGSVIKLPSLHYSCNNCYPMTVTGNPSAQNRVAD